MVGAEVGDDPDAVGVETQSGSTRTGRTVLEVESRTVSRTDGPTDTEGKPDVRSATKEVDSVWTVGTGGSSVEGGSRWVEWGGWTLVGLVWTVGTGGPGVEGGSRWAQWAGWALVGLMWGGWSQVGLTGRTGADGPSGEGGHR